MKKDKRILIVHRDTDFVDELTNYLLAGGYRNTESVNSYKDAFRRMKQNDFDIIVMDIFAPDMKGAEYAYKIKRLKPETKTLLMIEPEHRSVINRKGEENLEFDCLIKSNIAQDLLEYLKRNV